MNKELQKAYKDYNHLLGKDLNNHAALSTVHGGASEPKLIADGERLRAKIKKLEKENKEWEEKELKEIVKEMYLIFNKLAENHTKYNVEEVLDKYVDGILKRKKRNEILQDFNPVKPEK